MLRLRSDMEPAVTVNSAEPSTAPGIGEGFGQEVVAALSDPNFNEPDGEDTDESEEGEPEQGDDADLGGTEDDARSRYIPRQRFDEVNGKYREVAPLAPYRDFIEAAQTHLGLTPERAVEYAQRLNSGEITLDEAVEEAQQEQQVQQPAQATAETESLEEFAWRVYGEDVQSLDPLQRRFIERDYNREVETAQQARQQAEAQAQAQAQAEHQRTLAAIQHDFQALVPDFPDLKNPRFAKAFLNEFGEQHGIRPNAAAMRKHAEEFTADLKTLGRNQLSEQALAEARAASERPNTAGGASPGAAEDRSWIEDTSPEGDEKFSKGIRGILRTAFGNR